MTKYYTPEIEEFHVGFEYEYCVYPEASSEFIKQIADWDSLNIIYDDFEHEPKELFERSYRVKYLDQEDIESLGFELISDNKYPLSHVCKYRYPEDGSKVFSFQLHGTPKLIITQQESTNFVLKLKNKCELKKFLQWINI